MGPVVAASGARSPDHAEAVMLAFAPQIPTLGTEPKLRTLTETQQEGRLLGQLAC